MYSVLIHSQKIDLFDAIHSSFNIYLSNMYSLLIPSQSHSLTPNISIRRHFYFFWGTYIQSTFTSSLIHSQQIDLFDAIFFFKEHLFSPHSLTTNRSIWRICIQSSFNRSLIHSHKMYIFDEHVFILHLTSFTGHIHSQSHSLTQNRSS